MINRKYIIVGLVMILMSSLGCVEKDISSVVNTLPEVQQYLKEHPDARITATYMSKNDVEKISQDINNQCGKIIIPTDMYKVVVTDKDLKIISWIDTDNKNLLCSSTEGINKDSSNPVQTTSYIPINTIDPIITESIRATVRATIIPTETEELSSENPVETSVETSVNTPEYSADDEKFLSFIDDITDALSKDNDLFPSSDLSDDNYFKQLKVYGQTLEDNAEKYLKKMEEYTVSSKLQPVYNEYKAYVIYNKIAGTYCKLASEYHDQGNSDMAKINLGKYTLNMKKGILALEKAIWYLKKSRG